MLRSLGHEVVERDPDYGPLVAGNVGLRVLRGIADDAAASRCAGWSGARASSSDGRAIPDGLMARTRADEAGIADADRRAVERRRRAAHADHGGAAAAGGSARRPGGVVTLLADTQYTAYTSPFNATGQPAVSVPGGFARNGLPIGVQLVGRAYDEGTLLSLAAQIEAERPWAEQRPVVNPVPS